jgi:hypothetical protein
MVCAGCVLKRSGGQKDFHGVEMIKKISLGAMAEAEQFLLN